MIRNSNSRIINKRPNNFCYHCNENFATKDDLKYHVENIVKKQQSSGGNNGFRNGNFNSENEFPISHQNAAGHTLRSDFFRLDEREVEAIQSQSNPEYASFTLDGKECYHCGQEFHNEEQMKNHPNMCDRMKNARNYGQVNLQEFSQSIQTTGYNNDLYDNGIKIAKSNHKRKKTNKPTARSKKSKMELVHQDPRDLEYHEQGHEQVAHEHEQHVEYETHEYQTVSQPEHAHEGGEHDQQGHYEQKYQAQEEYEEKYDVAKYDQQTELVDTYPSYKCNQTESNNEEYQEEYQGEPHDEHVPQDGEQHAENHEQHVEHHDQHDEHHEQHVEHHDQHVEHHEQHVEHREQHVEHHQQHHSQSAPSANQNRGTNHRKGGRHHCYHCDYVFESREDLQRHVAEISKKNHAPPVPKKKPSSQRAYASYN